jgi:hypothetical protein
MEIILATLIVDVNSTANYFLCRDDFFARPKITRRKKTPGSGALSYFGRSSEARALLADDATDDDACITLADLATMFALVGIIGL